MKKERVLACVFLLFWTMQARLPAQTEYEFVENTFLTQAVKTYNEKYPDTPMTNSIDWKGLRDNKLISDGLFAAAVTGMGIFYYLENGKVVSKKYKTATDTGTGTGVETGSDTGTETDSAIETGTGTISEPPKKPKGFADSLDGTLEAAAETLGEKAPQSMGNSSSERSVQVEELSLAMKVKGENKDIKVAVPSLVPIPPMKTPTEKDAKSRVLAIKSRMNRLFQLLKSRKSKGNR